MVILVFTFLRATKSRFINFSRKIYLNKHKQLKAQDAWRIAVKVREESSSFGQV